MEDLALADTLEASGAPSQPAQPSPASAACSMGASDPILVGKRLTRIEDPGLQRSEGQREAFRSYGRDLGQAS